MLDELMEPRISIITLGVKNLDLSLKFYRDGLGFPTSGKKGDNIIFFQTGSTYLALYPFDKLAEDISKGFAPEKPKFTGITLAHNVHSNQEVDHILELAAKIGGKIEKPAQNTSWGGYSGYFSDPDGYLWEVARSVFDFNDDGSLVIK